MKISKAERNKLTRAWIDNNMFNDINLDMVGFEFDDNNKLSIHHIFNRDGKCVGLAYISRIIHAYIDDYLKTWDKEEYYKWNDYLFEVSDMVSNNLRLVSDEVVKEMIYRRDELLENIVNNTNNIKYKKIKNLLLYVREAYTGFKNDCSMRLYSGLNDCCVLYRLNRKTSNVRFIIKQNLRNYDTRSNKLDEIMSIYEKNQFYNRDDILFKLYRSCRKMSNSEKRRLRKKSSIQVKQRNYAYEIDKYAPYRKIDSYYKNNTYFNKEDLLYKSYKHCILKKDLVKHYNVKFRSCVKYNNENNDYMGNDFDYRLDVSRSEKYFLSRNSLFTLDFLRKNNNALYSRWKSYLLFLQSLRDGKENSDVIFRKINKKLLELREQTSDYFSELADNTKLPLKTKYAGLANVFKEKDINIFIKENCYFTNNIEYENKKRKPKIKIDLSKVINLGDKYTFYDSSLFRVIQNKKDLSIKLNKNKDLSSIISNYCNVDMMGLNMGYTNDIDNTGNELFDMDVFLYEQSIQILKYIEKNDLELYEEWKKYFNNVVEDNMGSDEYESSSYELRQKTYKLLKHMKNKSNNKMTVSIDRLRRSLR